MTDKKIRQVLIDAFVTWALEQQIPFAVPNVDFEPVVGNEYLQVWFLEAEPYSTSLSDAGELLSGIMQIDINVPYGQGEGRFLEIYELLRAVFKTNASINNKFGTVRLGKVYARGGGGQSPWYTKHVTVEYKAFRN